MSYGFSRGKSLRLMKNRCEAFYGICSFILFCAFLRVALGICELNVLLKIMFIFLTIRQQVYGCGCYVRGACPFLLGDIYEMAYF